MRRVHCSGNKSGGVLCIQRLKKSGKWQQEITKEFQSAKSYTQTATHQ